MYRILRKCDCHRCRFHLCRRYRRQEFCHCYTATLHFDMTIHNGTHYTPCDMLDKKRRHSHLLSHLFNKIRIIDSCRQSICSSQRSAITDTVTSKSLPTTRSCGRTPWRAKTFRRSIFISAFIVSALICNKVKSFLNFWITFVFILVVYLCQDKNVHDL